jgi:hypothetical protein
MSDNYEEHSRLVRLIRRIAREEVLQALDEHFIDCIHEEKPAEEADME